MKTLKNPDLGQIIAETLVKALKESGYNFPGEWSADEDEMMYDDEDEMGLEPSPEDEDIEALLRQYGLDGSRGDDDGDAATAAAAMADMEDDEDLGRRPDDELDEVDRGCGNARSKEEYDECMAQMGESAEKPMGESGPDMGPVPSGGREETTTLVHKTSGKEIVVKTVAMESYLASGEWEVQGGAEEDTTVMREDDPAWSNLRHERLNETLMAWATKK